MSSLKKGSDDEVSVLDISQESTNCNDSFNSSCRTGSSILEATLPPGVAPKGFVLIDEDVAIVEPHDILDSSVEPKPTFKVMFRDETVARKYTKRVRNFLRSIISSSSPEDSDESNLVLEVWDVEATGKNGSSVDESDGEIDEGSLFTIDTAPKLRDDFDIPTYGKKFTKPLEKSKVEDCTEVKDDCGPKFTCFNCLGNHNLRDCKEARNYNNIQKNRKEFVSKQGNKNMRYHHDDDQKFGHIIPGQISQSLRKALGLKDNELPRHIYGMRRLGYPPGWLEETRQQHSGLTLFNSDGVAELDPDAKVGEIVLEGDRDKYDVKQIIDFPGFNIPTPKGFRDEEKHYWGSETQVAYSKTTMLMSLSGKKVDDGYKRKKMKKNFNLSSSSDVNTSEMEIDEMEETLVESVPVNGLFVPPLPKDKPVNPPEPPPPDAEDFDSQGDLTPEPKNDSIASSSPTNSPAASDSESTSTTTSQLPQISTPISKTTIKSIELGTPILKSTSPYSRLPSSEKFSKNICDVINFENLPDATGKYEQMSGIIQKVRCTLAEMHKD
ncbi:zinc finger CCHC domain-containing protein 8 homolog isoform X2 [Belonocnema kinseyi]|uniref:zinc finger CCHC domain-containing protein 8 homolog isoform X2 n=1 Tax=Belonocnema kinseyi TaxID=2817044 RepID=UPI00143DCDB9|nr:zinc finger CCHC domain-containing protein 8 homolog isoform X2 [Belonocnema kinseyi]